MARIGSGALLGGAALLGLAVTGMGLSLGARPAAAQAPAELRAGGQLAAFRSEADLRQFLGRLARFQTEASQVQMESGMAPMPAPLPPPPAPPPAPSSDGAAASAAPAPANRSITNTQERDVDEGGIVKAVGDHLVVLRRGRLFTIDTSGWRLRAVDNIDAMPPGVDGRGDWYDEMLVRGDRIVVVGYSYARGGTEVNRFRMSPDGRLRF